MNCYIDSSVVLSALFGQRGVFAKHWRKISEGASSELLVVECNRVIDRYRLQGELDDDGIAAVKSALNHFVSGITLFSLERRILELASHSFPTVVGTLDAIHLSTALIWKNSIKKDIVLFSNDTRLCTAAKALGISMMP